MFVSDAKRRVVYAVDDAYCDMAAMQGSMQDLGERCEEDVNGDMKGERCEEDVNGDMEGLGLDHCRAEWYSCRGSIIKCRHVASLRRWRLVV